MFEMLMAPDRINFLRSDSDNGSIVDYFKREWLLYFFWPLVNIQYNFNATEWINEFLMSLKNPEDTSLATNNSIK